MRSCSFVEYRPVTRPTQRSFATIVVLLSLVGTSHPSRADDVVLGTILVKGERMAADAVIGPLGDRPVRDIPYSINSVSSELIANQQAQGLADIIKLIPSAHIEYRGGAELGRPRRAALNRASWQTIISMA